jgi:hypothetical protein
MKFIISIGQAVTLAAEANTNAMVLPAPKTLFPSLMFILIGGRARMTDSGWRRAEPHDVKFDRVKRLFITRNPR